MINKWLEFIDGLKIMSELCNDKFHYETFLNDKNSIELNIIEDDDILFSDDFGFLICKDSVIFTYNNYIDINMSKDFEINKNYLIEIINRIRKTMDYGDFDDRLKIIKGEI